jgi:hypothetical protein
MKLEKLLKPIKYLDENVILRQYTKLGQKINIDEGKKKYWIGQGLWAGYMLLSQFPNRELFGGIFNFSSYLAMAHNDVMYNTKGISGRFKEIGSSEEKVLDTEKEFYDRYNSIIRLPTFLFGAGLIGKFGIDLINGIKNKTTLEPTSWYCLIDGIGQLSLASSMYLKDTNPKLLNKVPLWKKALEYVKEKVDSFNPIPQPISVPAFKIAENQ